MIRRIAHKFVEDIPEALEPGVLYVSMRYATAVHSCFCGCGREVVTPLSPAQWRLTFDGESVSLHPSVGNWNAPCRSHYYIERDRIIGAPSWSEKEVARGQARDKRARAVHYAKKRIDLAKENSETGRQQEPHKGWLGEVKGLFGRRRR